MRAFYRDYESPTLGGIRPPVILRPVADVYVTGPAGGLPIQGLLDTGSDETVLPWWAVDRLGVKLVEGRSVEIHGIAGALPAMFGWVDFEFLGPDGPIRWSHLAAFSPGARTIFGLRGFLEYFVARFDGVKHEIKLQYRGKAPAPRFVPPAPRRSK